MQEDRKKKVLSLLQMQTEKMNFFYKQLINGTSVELEHTKNRRFARKIAYDHLRESPFYYIHLKKMERMIKGYKTKKPKKI